MANLDTLRHSTSHVMAQAVKNLFPKVILGIGPTTEDGFYYDFDNVKFKEEDFPRIEKEMKKIIKQKLPFKKKIVSLAEAKKIFKGEKYKLDLLKDRKGKLSVYYTGKDFFDLCKGPHVKNTGEIKAFKLMKLAGAYWRGSEKNKMLQRIYGTAFGSEKELRVYLNKLKEADKRDHIKLGKQLDLYSINPEIGQGLVLWHPKGATVRTIIEDFWKKEHIKREYQYVVTPHIGREELWKKSGHLDFYEERMYGPMKVEDRNFRIKPMNCPFHIFIYNAHKRSYKDLPLRYCELGTVYRFERSGTLHGLTRVRGFTQDDAHIYCTMDQLQKEVEKVLELSIYMMKTFGFKYELYLSTRDPKNKKKFLGSDKIWNSAEKILKNALKKRKFKMDVGGAVFYGPKIDIKLYDALGREWQGPTCQVDFNLPDRFNLTYSGKDNKKHRVVMVHRTVIGSMERFMGNLIEHYAGAFPLWLAPIQVKVLTFTDRNKKYSEGIIKKLRDADIRVEEDFRSESVQYKIRESELQKIPYTIVCGDKEQKAKTIAIRPHKKKPEFGVKVDSFIKKIKSEVEKKI